MKNYLFNRSYSVFTIVLYIIISDIISETTWNALVKIGGYLATILILDYLSERWNPENDAPPSWRAEYR